MPFIYPTVMFSVNEKISENQISGVIYVNFTSCNHVEQDSIRKAKTEYDNSKNKSHFILGGFA